MVGKVVVFRRQQGLDEFRGDVRETDRCPPHLAELGDQLPIAAIHAQRYLQLDAAQGIDRRKTRAKVEISAAETEQQPTKNSNARPPEKLQQAYQDSWISRQKNELSGNRSEKGKTDHIISVFFPGEPFALLSRLLFNVEKHKSSVSHGR